MTFIKALQVGYAGRIECRPYLDWLKTLPCATCGAGAPSDPSHYNGLKGMGTKSADLLAIPQCRKCHEHYELSGGYLFEGSFDFLELAALYLLQAYFEGRLVWQKL